MDQKQKQQRKEIQEKLEKKAARFHKLFTSPAGKLVLKDLEDEFNPDVLLGKSDSETNYNVGKRDVYIYITQLIRYKENAARQRELERQSTS